MEFLNSNENIMDVINKLNISSEIKNIQRSGYNYQSCHVFLTKPIKLDNLPTINLLPYSKKYLKVMNQEDIFNYFNNLINNKFQFEYLGKDPINGPDAHALAPSHNDSYEECGYCLNNCNFNCISTIPSEETTIIWWCKQCNQNMCYNCFNTKEPFKYDWKLPKIPEKIDELIDKMEENNEVEISKLISNKDQDTYIQSFKKRTNEKYEVYIKMKQDKIDKCKSNHEYINKYIYHKYSANCYTCFIPIYRDKLEATHYDIDDSYFFVPHYTSLGEKERIYHPCSQKQILHICKDCYDNNIQNSKEIVAEKNMRFLDRYSKECYSFEETGLNSMLYWIPIIMISNSNPENGSWVFMNLNPDDINYKKFAFMTTDYQCYKGFFVVDLPDLSLDDLLTNLEKASHLLKSNRLYKNEYANNSDSEDDALSISSNDTYNSDSEDDALSISSNDTYNTEGDRYELNNPINIVMNKKFGFPLNYQE